MKNYLEHNDKVKYVDGLLAHSQDWQWFIDLLQESFDIHELSSWPEYEANNRPIRDVFSYFVKVLEVSDKNWQFSKPEFLEVWEIARFYIGGQEFEECSAKVTTTCGKLTLFCIWITKIGNIGSSSDNKYIFDIRILNQKNYYQLIDLEYLLINEDALIEFGKSIGAAGIEKPLKCLEDNLARVEYPYDINFFTKNEEKLLHYNAMSFQHIAAEPYASWQECYLLDMAKVSLSDRKLKPLFTSNSGSVPDTSLWTMDLLDSMKRYFSHKCADFLIDTILFVLHDRDIPEETVQTHLKLLTEALEAQEEMYIIFSSSSFEIISMLFEKRKLKGLLDDTDLRRLLNSIHSISDAQRIIRLKKNYYHSRYGKTP